MSEYFVGTIGANNQTTFESLTTSEVLDDLQLNTTDSPTFNGLTVSGDVTVNKLRMGNTQLYPSGDSNHIHFIGTALIGNSTTASSNPKIGTSTYPFSQVHAGYLYGDGSNLTNCSDSTKLPLAGGTLTGHLKLNDSKILFIGTGNDLTLSHNGWTTSIRNNSGNWSIEQNVPEGNLDFRARGSSGWAKTCFTLDGGEINGSTVLGATVFPDKSRIMMGSGKDLQIYHDGSNSYIADTSGTGSLIVNTDAFLLKSANNGEFMMTAYQDGAVNLYHNNATKLSTTSSGISVTGSVTATSLIKSGGTSSQFLKADGSVDGSTYVSSETVTSLALTSGSLVYTDEGGTANSISLAAYLDEDSRSIASGSLNSGNGVVTFTRDDSTTFTLDLGDLLDDTNLVTSVAGKSGVVSLVKGDVGLGNVTNESKATMFTSPSFTGDVVITDDTFPFIRSVTNGTGAGIRFSDQTADYTQNGTLTFLHGNGSSYGSNAAFILGTSETSTTILADGKLMYHEGIYSKPSTGTGAGTRKDTNWDTAYTDRNKWDGGSTGLTAATGRTSLGLGSAATQNTSAFATANQGTSAETAFGWGNHASAGYAASSHTHAASAITSGTFADARIPSLAASKITSGNLDNARMPTHVDIGGKLDIGVSTNYGTTTNADKLWIASFNTGQSDVPGSYYDIINLSSHSSHGIQIASSFGASSGAIYMRTRSDNNAAPSGSGLQAWNKIWHHNNDGTGSGLDADLLDAQEGSYYLNYNNFTNTPTIPSLSGYATQSYVGTQISNLIDSSPAALNTLNELAAALGDDANFSTTITNSIATKAPLASPTFTGAVTLSGSIQNNNQATSIDLKDHSNYTWFRNAANRWVFQGGTDGDDWTQHFALKLETVGTGYNDKYAELGQQQNNGSNGGRYKGVRIVKSTGSSSVVDGELKAGDGVFSGSVTGSNLNISNWNTAYTDRNKWDGGSTGLTAATGRSSLGLGSAATQNTSAFATANQGTSAETAFGWGNHASAGYATTDNNTFRTVTAGGNTLGSTETLAFTAGSNVTITESAGAVTITAANDNTQLSTAQVRSKISGTGLISYNSSTGVISTTANNYSLPEATATVRGGIELFSNTDQSVAANSVSSTSGRTYGIQLNSAGQAVVNVPWSDTNTDTNTTYSAGTHLSLSGTTFNVDFATTDKVVNIGHNATTNNEGEIILDTSIAGSPQIGFTEHGDASWAIGVDDGDNSFKIHGSAGATIPTINNLTTPLFEITTSGAGYVNGSRIFADSYHPNADTLTTARTIAGTSFNGSSNIDISYNNLTNKPTIPSAYSLPLASSSTRGGVKIGFSESGKNYPVELDSSEKMFVNVPWSDTNTDTNTFRTVTAGGNTLGSGETLALTAGSNVSISEAGGQVTISSTDTNTVYSHPTHNGDDINIDTGALTGATVISDLDFNITTNSLGHVTDANGAVATRTLTAANLGISAPNAPASASAAIVGNTVEVTFAASTTSDIGAYLVYSSIDGSDYGLISIVPPDDFAASMSIIDNAFDETGTQAYRVYAVKYGILSSATTASVSYTVSSAEPTTMSVVNLNNAYYVQWNPPSSNARFVTAYNVYKHEHATQGSLSRGSASLIYSGMNTNYMYQISGTNNSNFHQFWVETTIA